MNKERRKQIRQVAVRLSIIKTDLINLKNDEENYYDSIPENLENSFRAEESEDSIETLEEMLESLEEIIDVLNEF